MTQDLIHDETSSTDRPVGDRGETPAGRRRLLIGIALSAAIIVIAVIALALLRDDNSNGVETADISGQGGTEPIVAEDGARLTRRADGLVAELSAPTPVPGSYEYPTSDMIPPWADPHPRVVPGASGAPEVFTTWVFVFNAPELCTGGACDTDDLGPDAAARGGSYQLDGLIADGKTMVFSGHIRLGQAPVSGAPMDNPDGAEVHLAIAAHGRALPGSDGWRQLNGPLGAPTLWWAASFIP